MTGDRRASGKTAGFVLLEVLVGLTLLSLMLGLFALTLGLASRVADAGRARAEIVEAATGATVLSAALASALPLGQASAQGPARILFEGSAKELSFLTLSNGDALSGGIRAITIAIEEAGARRAGVVVFHSSLVPIGTLALKAGGQGETLIRDVASARFSYFGSSDSAAPEQWRDEWKNAERLPRLVALRGRQFVNRKLEYFEVISRVLSE